MKEQTVRLIQDALEAADTLEDSLANLGFTDEDSQFDWEGQSKGISKIREQLESRLKQLDKARLEQWKRIMDQAVDQVKLKFQQIG